MVQAQALLDANHPSTLIIPLLDEAEPLRIQVPASGLQRASDLLVDQLRAIDNRRLVQGPMTRLSKLLMNRIEQAIREVLDFDDANH